jgi:DnaJ-class molecular chaperone
VINIYIDKFIFIYINMNFFNLLDSDDDTKKGGPSYYEILGVSKKATKKEIKNAYKKLACKWHPDKNPDNSEEAGIKFKEITEAYQTLLDEEKREDYDMFGKNDDLDLNMSMNNDNDDNNGNDNVMDDEELKKIFTENPFFKQCLSGLGGMGGMPGMSSSGPIPINVTGSMPNGFHFGIPGMGMPIPGMDIPTKKSTKNKVTPTVHNVYCTLEELYKGTTKTITTENISRTIKIRRGWKDGTKIKYNDDPPVIAVIKERSHDTYTRNGDDFILTYKITLDQAKSGFMKTIKTMKGKRKIKFKPLASSGEQRTISGYGMPIRKNGQVGGYGKLIIKFDVQF